MNELLYRICFFFTQNWPRRLACISAKTYWAIKIRHSLSVSFSLLTFGFPPTSRGARENILPQLQMKDIFVNFPFNFNFNFNAVIISYVGPGIILTIVNTNFGSFCFSPTSRILRKLKFYWSRRYLPSCFGIVLFFYGQRSVAEAWTNCGPWSI